MLVILSHTATDISCFCGLCVCDAPTKHRY